MKKDRFNIPVSFHIFNRPFLTERVFNAIREVKPKYLFVTADGPRNSVPDDAEKCKAVRALVENNIDWPCELYKNYSDLNQGSYKSTSYGITWVFDKVDEAIILEDDCLPNISFFKFCSELLDYYRADTRISMISGNNFIPNMNGYNYSYYFSRYTHIWGWATWKRTWDLVELDMKGWSEYRKNGGLKNVFVNDYEVNFWDNLFQGMYAQKSKPHWDYKLLLSSFMNNSLTVIPAVNLVSNIGAGPDGTNCKAESRFHNLPSWKMSFPLKHPHNIYRLNWADEFTELNVFSSFPASQVVSLIQQAVYAMQSNKHEDALKKFIEAKSLMQPTQNIEYLKAVCLIKMNRYIDARESLKEELRYFPGNIKAERLLKKLQTNGPNVILDKVDDSYSRLSKANKVVEASNKLLLEVPPSEIIQNLKLNENEKVLALSDKTISLYPSLIGVLYGKAIALSKLERYNEAVDCLKHLLSKCPKHEKAAILLEALQENTAPIKYMLKKANEYLTKGNIRQAFKLLNQLKAKKRPLQNIDLLRAHCFLRMNQITSAQQALKEELRYFPENSDARRILKEIILKNTDSETRRRKEPEFLELLQKIRPYTMLSEDRLFSLFTLTKKICFHDIIGNIAECGVAAGGSTALMAAIIKKYSKRPRILYAFDSFEGMPTPTEHDKHAGIGAEDTGWGSGTCAAPEESVKSICQKLGVSDIVKVVKGYFEKTLPDMKHKVGSLAFLHMDSDWYESTRVILDYLYDYIIDGGIIQVDDYGFWEGCRKAINEFEQKRNIQFIVNKIDSTGIWFSKV